ncbi:MAG: hypothetical protein J0I47_15200 [Sphingomonas sp.]|uniref:jacalin-like lectin n=1 Tax=Sphingomonas sp. TaxID=28214 RepID=UPI001AD4819D|nr:jacalin-like lectin [Sphingomonas sp.]MBN8809565.1 hypothetical protein [Sphingomonas sp.]
METIRDAALDRPTPALALGYDTVLRAIRSTAITADTKTVGAETTVNMSVCKGTSEVMKALSIDQSVSILGLGSVDEKMAFVQKQKTTEQSVSIVVHASHQTGTQTAANPTLDPSLHGQATGDFVRAYGDSYVDSISWGGEYYAMYTFYSETAEESRDLTLSLKASGIVDGMQASASMDTKISSFASTTAIDWSFDQKVSGANTAMPGREGIIDFALKFPALPLDAPVVVAYTTAGYEHVAKFDIDFATIVANRSCLLDPTTGLIGALGKVTSLQNAADRLQAIYRCYGYTVDTALQGFEDALATDVAAIKACVAAYAGDPTAKVVPPPLPSLSRGTPTLDFASHFACWGGPGGDPFDFGDVRTAVRNQQRLVWLQLHGQKYVDAILLQYRSVRGKSGVVKHGGDGGVAQNGVNLDDDEYVQIINTRADVYCDNVWMQTTRNQITQVGDQGGTAAGWTVPADGTVVLGFQGRASRFLDQLGVVTMRLQPAKFV